MIQQILKNRELRAKRQKELLALHKKPLISVTVNIPGEKKLTKDAVFIYDTMIDILKKSLKGDLSELYFAKEVTGIEGIYTSILDAQELKKMTMRLEEGEILGRFIDFDVIDTNGKILSRKDFNQSPRKCYLCKNRAVICARSRAHDVNDLLKYIKFCVKSYQTMITMSEFASISLKKEVDLTPKPGLVDLNDSGSHEDMDRFTFYKSIDSIKEYFLPFLSAGFLYEENLFQKLRSIGLECEKSMFISTSNINTHKGIIFSYAVILGSIGAMSRQNIPLNEKSLVKNIKYLCKDLVKKDLSQKKAFKSAGERYFNQTKNGGIREEAQNGYPHIFLISLPFYRSQKKDFSEDKALKMTLLKLISELEDTTLYNRGGIKGIKFAKEEAKKLLLKGIDDEKLSLLNQLFIQKHLSPGGSADILALTWFLDKIL